MALVRPRLGDDATPDPKRARVCGEPVPAAASAAHVGEAAAPLLCAGVPSLGDAQGERLSIGTVVKIYVTGIQPSYLMPWQVLQQSKWTGSGFVLDCRLIMTNAHVVQNASVLQLQRQGNPKKFRARTVQIAHDLDLALVEVADELFWADLPAAVFADGLPEMFSEVKAVGFPQGGSTVCVTKGVVSRIDAQLYAHPGAVGVVPDSQNSPGNLLLLQIDAAINPGNSGGPTFDVEGKVVGVASSSLSKAQNVGYIIPVCVVEMFLEEVARTSAWTCISELGITLRALELDSLRAYLKMPQETTGVLVERVAPLGALAGIVEPADVITQIDGHDISNEGKVPIEVSGQKIFVPADALVTKKAKGTATRFRILRDGVPMDLSAVAAPIEPLMPRFHAHDCTPEYLVFGGLVFTKLTIPLKHEYACAVQSRTYGDVIFRSAIWDAGLKVYKADPKHEVVVLLRVLEHDINIGCPGGVRILESFNGEEVRCLAQFARSVAAALGGEERFLRLRFKRDGEDNDSGVPDVVLERDKVRAADEEICEKNRISSFASESLGVFFEDSGGGGGFAGAAP